MLYLEHHFLVRKTLENRGISDDFLQDMDAVVSEVMADAELLCEHLHQLHERGACITFLPDYDMDGIASGIIGFAGLSELGFNVRLFIPDASDGYGFDERTIDRLLLEYPETEAILTADVGITCYAGVAYAKKLGLRVLITDHHAEKSLDLQADCVVDPMRAKDPYSFPYICGASVIYKCLQMYADRYCNLLLSEQISRLRVFAGIGTVSDGMPVYHENRKLIRDAVSICRMLYSDGDAFAVGNIRGTYAYCRAFFGLHTVLCVFAEHGKLRSVNDIDETFFGYYLAPVFNSAKRMCGDMNRVFCVFFGQYQKVDMEYLYDLNLQRKAVVSECMSELSGMSGSAFSPYIYVIDAPAGVLGLLAQNVMSETGRPAIVVRSCDDGSYSGSGRSPDWYPMLSRSDGRGAYVAGHENAFGVTFSDMDELSRFYDFLSEDVSHVFSGLGKDAMKWIPDFVIDHDGNGDTVIDIVDFIEYLDDFMKLRPFGRGFSGPDILLRFRPDDGEWSLIGSEKQHLKIRLPRGFDVLLWNQGYDKSVQMNKKLCFVRGRLEIGVFRDVQTVQFVGSFISEEVLA